MSSVGFDLDGVNYNFADGIRSYFHHIGIADKYPIGEMGTHPAQYDWWSDWGMTSDEWYQHIHDGVDAGFVFGGGCIDDGPAQINRVYDAGHEVHIVTARHFGRSEKNSERNTRLWLEEHEVKFTSLTFARDKTVVPTDFFIEDVVSNYDALDSVGTKAYLINRPWNEQNDNRRRVNSVKEFVDAILVN